VPLYSRNNLCTWKRLSGTILCASLQITTQNLNVGNIPNLGFLLCEASLSTRGDNIKRSVVTNILVCLYHWTLWSASSAICCAIMLELRPVHLAALVTAECQKVTDTATHSVRNYCSGCMVDHLGFWNRLPLPFHPPFTPIPPLSLRWRQAPLFQIRGLGEL